MREVRIFSRDEKKQDDMRKSFNHPKLKFYIGDVRDYQSLNNALAGVDFVFHAAALKQVPSCEFYPLEAVKTNILGTENVIEAAFNRGVRRVICLSTDKAVYPDQRDGDLEGDDGKDHGREVPGDGGYPARSCAPPVTGT